MQTMTCEHSRFSKKWIIVASAAVLLLVLLFSFPLFGQTRGRLMGRVAFNGKPIVIGTVIANCADGLQRSARIDGQGAYVIENIPQGKVQVGVISRDPAKSILRQQKMNNASNRLPNDDHTVVLQIQGGKWVSIPANYEDPRSSGLETVVKGTTEYLIELR